jgi:hypothetical protein
MPQRCSRYQSSRVVVASRRKALVIIGGAASSVITFQTHGGRASAAALLPAGKQRRQLDLCIVTLLRVKYWAQMASSSLQQVEPEERRKQHYLETRLAAKALVSQKVGGGATFKVYTLSTLQFRGCLDDIAWYSKSKEVTQLAQDLIESLAAIVEFDGLETTTDPSPRSSLTLSAYTPQKETFVRRMLSERVIPLSDGIVNSFDPAVRQRCDQYVQATYPNEISQKESTNNSVRPSDSHE